ncbi:hypothetical protein [Petrachloros mirabilis]
MIDVCDEKGKSGMKLYLLFLFLMGIAGLFLAAVAGLDLPNSWAVAGWPIGLYMFYRAFKGLLDHGRNR